MNLDIYTNKSKEAIQSAQQLMSQNHNPQLEQIHLLVALLQQDGGLVPQLLKKMDVTVESLEAAAKTELGKVPSVTGSREADRFYISADMDAAFTAAEAEASTMKDEFVSVEHLFLGLLETAQGGVKRIFSDYRITKEAALKALQSVRGNQRVTSDSPEGTYDALEKYGTDLVKKAKEQKMDPVIGRDEEIRNVIRILSRKTKNNPVLIGEPGVGKTAIAEGLAQKIAAKDVPYKLQNKEVYLMDLTALVAGTQFRGQFESRMKGLIEEVKKLGNIILVIDEVHNLVGAGDAEGSMNAANILKPALSRGEIQIVGATTLSEYRKHIEKDAAFERRFQPVTVAEPTEDESFQILRGLRDRYEAHHGLKITDEALTAAVKLSARYISDRFLPDKAIDLVDEAASRVRMENLTAPDEMKTIEAKLATLSAQKEEAVRAQDYELAAQLRDRERSERGALEKARGEWDAERGGHRGVVSAEDIAAVVSGWTGIPVTSLTESESERLLHMEDVLHRRVIGQNEAVAAVAHAIRRGRVGLKDPHRPVGSFLFLGPTGVGKTELCRALAEAMFGDENAMIRVDMSEYMEKHTVSKLIGSPPGYVGFDEGGQLTEKVRRKPYSVVLFDEIEKAHEDVFNLLLQIMDDGRLTDSQGRTVDFRNTVIVMTSNIGARAITDRRTALGFSGLDGTPERSYAEIREAVTAELKKTFRPEFLNRIDEIIVFHRLTGEDIRVIAGNMVQTVALRAAALGVHLTVTPEAIARLAEAGYDPDYGARPLRRTVQTQLEDPLAEALLTGELSSGGEAEAVVDETGHVAVRAKGALTAS